MTTATAKTIQIYLPTGEPRGIRIAEITTRIVQAVLIPRSDLAQGKRRKELDLPGVYFLFGDVEDEAKPVVYIGQSEDGRNRFDSHNKTKSFWKTAIFCVSKTQNFTQAHIRYLEWYCMQRAKEVGRYNLENGQVPVSSNYVPEPMEAELLDVFETISTLVSSLGYPVFEPISKPNRSSEIFYCQGGGSDGKGELVEEGFVVHSGSKARIQVTPSATSSVTPHRERLIAAGVLEEVEGQFVFKEDYLFSSPSTAAGIVLGRSANGWVEWKNTHGATLNDVYREDSD
ncbi:GIY-YIG nuclease family protein [Thalassoglobus sp. JC818]|uniref:GIY-YIG nuclease family protein n=1 Tax=Thalassoglobus sp. JC818 TaxID=3232136 RepID=UPI0034596A1F